MSKISKNTLQHNMKRNEPFMRLTIKSTWYEELHLNPKTLYRTTLYREFTVLQKDIVRNWHFMRLTIKSTWYEELDINPKPLSIYFKTIEKIDLLFFITDQLTSLAFFMHEIYIYGMPLWHGKLSHSTNNRTTFRATLL